MIKVEEKSSYIEITIDREKNLNSLSPEVFDALYEELSKLNTQLNTGLNVVLIRTAGDRAFVAGADIKAMSSMSSEDLSNFSNKAHKVIELISTLPCVVISYVDGIAYGGGLELALGSDLIIVSEAAKFALPELKLGLIPGFGGTQRIIERCGLGLARRMIFLSQELDSEQAVELGLVDYMAQGEEDIEQLIENLASKSRESLMGAKSSINTFFSKNLEIGIEKEKEEFLKAFESENAKEGITAFMEKRKAVFS